MRLELEETTDKCGGKKGGGGSSMRQRGGWKERVCNFVVFNGLVLQTWGKRWWLQWICCRKHAPILPIWYYIYNCVINWQMGGNCNNCKPLYKVFSRITWAYLTSCSLAHVHFLNSFAPYKDATTEICVTNTRLIKHTWYRGCNVYNEPWVTHSTFHRIQSLWLKKANQCAKA